MRGFSSPRVSTPLACCWFVKARPIRPRLDLGFGADRSAPNCAGGMAILVKMVQQYRPEGVVIVADADAPGRRGAENLAIVLLAYSASVRVIAPPPSVKNTREWKRQGATHADVQAAIDAAPVRRLAISTRIRGKAGHDAK